mmetsp:Transcript_32248/g.100140  ORF Transcript_32248/g.100140 Transcript_32248/m.100140 type:complete len:129 (+) Transcript_32248:80-466(+)|eukprot:CAMPEP_0204588634 /NCGR_PEP_ID=MMETSP0661-20131031/48729_1 /ASSEMBLY_ACC=CAM_ASM_000606 /TAXON_ID=109239 /ORGANISM="Alexandrium margalefi, Strain AMGDE01CS-322" /LENGTH=128 /DNA_ID=CAMNT_0051598461 /DNA_START=56 /DNA_END=442 /DNA_ORIENTATION=-
MARILSSASPSNRITSWLLSLVAALLVTLPVWTALVAFSMQPSSSDNSVPCPSSLPGPEAGAPARPPCGKLLSDLQHEAAAPLDDGPEPSEPAERDNVNMATLFVVGALTKLLSSGLASNGPVYALGM